MRKDGSLVEVSTTVSPIFDLAGHVIGAAAVTRDISRRKAAEEAHRESEKRYRALFDSSPLPMWVFDPVSLGFVEVNAAAIEHYGFSREEFLGMTLKDIRPPEDVPKLLVSLDRHEVRNDVGNWRHRKKDGSIIEVNVFSHVVAINDRRLRLALMRDVTAQRRLEEQFLQAQKMEVVGRMAGGIAHDFNNILTVLLGYCELFDQHRSNEAALDHDIQQVRGAVNRGAALTRQLLTFSRADVARTEVLDPSEVVEGLAGMLHPLLGEGIDLVISKEQQARFVKIDRTRLEQVLMNLAINARDAMPGGGRLSIEVRRVVLDGSYAEAHRGVEPGPHVLIAVTDTGMGMDPGTQSRLFEPFFTTKAKEKGTGLGLTTVYGIVQQAGGSIWVYSEVNRGTVFKIYFPLVRRTGETHIAKPVDPVPADPRSATILVIEDDKSIRAMVVEYLIAKGYEIIDASDGNDADASARNHPGPIHLLLSDIVLPAGSGREIADRIRKERPDMRILFMSGYTDDVAVPVGSIPEDAHFLQKPFGLDALVRKIRGILG